MTGTNLSPKRKLKAKALAYAALLCKALADEITAPSAKISGGDQVSWMYQQDDRDVRENALKRKLERLYSLYPAPVAR